MAKVLMCHQDVLSAVKEPHVWTRSMNLVRNSTRLYQRFTESLMRQLFRKHKIFGDYSASTFWQWQASQKSLRFATVPAQIRHSLPDVPLIVMLRDPTKRCVSTSPR